MDIKRKRKFIAFNVTIGLFFALMLFMILLVLPHPAVAAEISALGAFAGYLAGGLMAISGAFYVYNVKEHQTNKDD